jgi:Na+-transporting NADH:ubiquinone oxidoreductase subunit NqrD
LLLYYLYFSPVKASKWEKLKDCCSPLAPRGKVGEVLTICLVVIIVWTTSYVMLGRVAIPTDEKIDVSIQAGTVFALIVLLVASTIGGWLVSLVVDLSSFLGMLILDHRYTYLICLECS